MYESLGQRFCVMLRERAVITVRLQRETISLRLSRDSVWPHRGVFSSQQTSICARLEHAMRHTRYVRMRWASGPLGLCALLMLLLLLLLVLVLALLLSSKLLQCSENQVLSALHVCYTCVYTVC